MACRRQESKDVTEVEFYMPTHLFTGPDCLGTNGAQIAGLGKRCLLVTGGTAAVRSGALTDVTAVLEEQGIAYTGFDQVRPNPTLASCQEAGRLAHRFEADFVVGIGGGSALDAAKAASVFAANPEFTEADFYKAAWSEKPLPIVLVGTTAGTGSEVTSVAVLTDSAGRKHSIHDPRLYAALAFGDPRHTMSLPKHVTLSTGIDAVAHCVESAFSRKADRLSRLFSVQGIRLACEVLREATREKPLSLAQRAQLYDASIFGGLAINRTGTVFPHNVGYFLTEQYGIPHGFACGCLMPDLLDHMKTAAPDRAESLYREAGITEEALRELVEDCVPPLAVSAGEEEILKALPRWRNNGSVQNTIGSVGEAQIAEILRKHLL